MNGVPKKLVCYHEAGHAVMASLLGVPILFATVATGSGERQGHVRTENICAIFQEPERLAVAAIQMLLAGCLSEMILSPKGFASKLQHKIFAKDLYKAGVLIKEIKKAVPDFSSAIIYEETLTALSKNKKSIRHVARALAHKHTLEQEEIYALLQ
jgi:ATP-dependent Zn protease